MTPDKKSQRGKVLICCSVVAALLAFVANIATIASQFGLRSPFLGEVPPLLEISGTPDKAPNGKPTTDSGNTKQNAADSSRESVIDTVPGKEISRDIQEPVAPPKENVDVQEILVNGNGDWEFRRASYRFEIRFRADGSWVGLVTSPANDIFEWSARAIHGEQATGRWSFEPKQQSLTMWNVHTRHPFFHDKIQVFDNSTKLVAVSSKEEFRKLSENSNP